jgi:DNA-directed RNA polymerase alpha subunit
MHSVSTRARNVLKRNKISTVEQLLSLSEEELSSFRNAGAKTVHELVQLQNWLQQSMASGHTPVPNMWALRSGVS